MARAPYLTRREGGRYYLQIRLGKFASELYERPVLRASLKTSVYAEAKRRLMSSFAWAVEIVNAPDLDSLGFILLGRLNRFTGLGQPDDERTLADRQAFEHQVRTFITRCRERQYLYSHKLPGFVDAWCEFIRQNQASEVQLAIIARRREYERGRSEATEALANGWAATSTASRTPIEPAPTASSRYPDLPPELQPFITESADNHALVPAQSSEVEITPSTISEVEIQSSLRLSEVIEKFYTYKKKRKPDDRTRGNYGPVLSFMIDFLNDPLIGSLTEDDFDRVEKALPDIPKRNGIHRDHTKSLMARYNYAKAHKWEKLTRLTARSIEKYHAQIEAFFKWAKSKNIYTGPNPDMAFISPENFASIGRDAFDTDELVRLFSLALFTGCGGNHRIWTRGNYFIQNHLYWAYLILAFTGMRAGEVGQIRCNDLVCIDGLYFFDLRPFDPRGGRVAIKDLRQLKTRSSDRIIPIHPLLVDLGLLRRAEELSARGEGRLFPEWKPYQKLTGELRWGQPITKSWQYVKTLLKVMRADIALYSTRHLMAEALDNEAIAQRTRDRILGHAGSASSRYGRKNSLSEKQSEALIAALDSPVICQISEILLATKEKADRGELIVLKPWLATRQPS